MLVRFNIAPEEGAMIRNRDERLQIMLEPEELRAVEDFRFKYRLPSRAAAVRELMRRGLGGQKTGEADGFLILVVLLDISWT